MARTKRRPNEVELRPRSPEAVVAYYDGQIAEMRGREKVLRSDLEHLGQRIRIAEGMREIARESRASGLPSSDHSAGTGKAKP